MTIDCKECLRIISRQIDRATSDKETQEARAHAVKCESCRVKFNHIAGADRIFGRAVQSLRLTDGFSATVAEKLAEARLAETTRGAPVYLYGIAGGLALLIVILGIMLASPSGPEIPAIGTIGRTDGRDISMAGFESDSFRSMETGDKIFKGSRIRTGLAAVIIKLDGEVKLALNSNSLIDLSRFHDGRKIILESGQVYAVDVGGGIHVETPGAKVYGVDASFAVGYNSSGVTELVVKSGEAALFGTAGTLTVMEGTRTEIRRNEKPDRPTEVKLENHIGWLEQVGM